MRERVTIRSMAAGVALALAACAGTAPPGIAQGDGLAGTVWEVATATEITPEALAERLAAADLAILGEIHDNALHHERQAWLVERIEPDGIAFEMVPEASERGIAVLLEQGAEPDEIGPAIGWDRLGWPDWTLYAPVFAAAPGARIAGGGQPRAALTRAISEGAAVAYGDGAEVAGLTEALDTATQAAAEAEMIASHCDALPAAAAPGMVEAQRLRDAAFARAALRARGTTGRAVLVTGNGHARTDRGAALYAARIAPGLDIVSLGQVEVGEGALDDGADAVADLPYDYVWFSGGVEGRPDPCAAFRSRE